MDIVEQLNLLIDRLDEAESFAVKELAQIFREFVLNVDQANQALDLQNSRLSERIRKLESA